MLFNFLSSYRMQIKNMMTAINEVMPTEARTNNAIDAMMIAG